jgi:hypothetical protein
MADRAFLEALSRRLADEGKLIEAGWIGLRLMWLPGVTQGRELQAMRMAFMAGALHLFFSIMTVLEEDAEPTETDLNRMELEAFGRELERMPPPRGSA